MISPDPSAVFRHLEDGGVILNIENGAYFQVNATGRFIWESLDGGIERDELIESLAGVFHIDRERSAADVDTFLQHLDKRSLVLME
jgi:hypothetical protein